MTKYSQLYQISAGHKYNFIYSIKEHYRDGLMKHLLTVAKTFVTVIQTVIIRVLYSELFLKDEQ